MIACTKILSSLNHLATRNEVPRVGSPGYSVVCYIEYSHNIYKNVICYTFKHNSVIFSPPALSPEPDTEEFQARS